MTKDEYKEYLKSEHWEEVRLKRIKIDNRRCYLCGGVKGLNVHHLRYDNLWHEDAKKDLVTLCYKCHHMLHRVIDASKYEYRRFYVENKTNPCSCHSNYLFNCLENSVKSYIIKEIWLRESEFGGDLNVFFDKMQTAKRLIKIVEIVYPDIGRLNIAEDIKKNIENASDVLSAPIEVSEIKPREKRKKRRRHKKSGNGGKHGVDKRKG